MSLVTDALETASLENLYCNNCKNLLSVPPTYITISGHYICGRCENQCVDPSIRDSQYDLLAKQFRYPCMYASEGCEETVHFTEVKVHEQQCPYRELECYNVNCLWSGIPVELIVHYKKHHPLQIIDSNLHQLREGMLSYMVIKDKFCYMLRYEYSNSQLALELYPITPSLNASIVCTLFNVDVEVVTRFPIHPNAKMITQTIRDCKAFFIDVDLRNCSENSIKCPVCQHPMTLPILKCPLGHITCADCFDTIFNYCVICEKDDLMFVRDHALENEAALTLYTCKWGVTDCGTFSIRQIKQHEVDCVKRVYECMNCCDQNWEGPLTGLMEHDVYCAAKCDIPPLIIETFVKFLCSNIPE